MEYIERERFLAEQRHLYCENCARRKGMKNGKMRFVYEIGDAPCRACGIGDVLDDVEDFPAADVRPVPEGGIGEMSDGYHTFNGMYYLRGRHEEGKLMYGELVKRLHRCASEAAVVTDAELMIVARDAADAIEELSKFAETMRRLKCEGWYLQQSKFHDGYQAMSTMPLPDPPKEEP